MSKNTQKMPKENVSLWNTLKKNDWEMDNQQVKEKKRKQKKHKFFERNFLLNFLVSNNSETISNNRNN